MFARASRAAVLAVTLAACTGAANQTPTLGPSAALSPVAPTCTPEGPTGPTGSWQTHQALSGAFSFDYPSGWTDESGDIGTTVSDLLAPETQQELEAADETVNADVVQDAESRDNLGAFQLEGGGLDTATVYARQEDLFGAFVNFEIQESDLEECVGGTPALGLEIAGEKAPGEGIRVQRLFYLVRDGELFVLYVDAGDETGVATFHEVLRTWSWSGVPTEPAEGSAVSFRLTRTTAQIDQDADKPDGSSSPTPSPRTRSACPWSTRAWEATRTSRRPSPGRGPWSPRARNAPPVATGASSSSPRPRAGSGQGSTRSSSRSREPT